MQEPRLEGVFGVLNKLLGCPGFKREFYVDFVLAAASEDASLMENACLLGRLIGLAIVVRDDFSDVKRVRAKIQEKVKACKTQSGYEKTLKVGAGANAEPVCRAGEARKETGFAGQDADEEGRSAGRRHQLGALRGVAAQEAPGEEAEAGGD